MGKSVRLSSWSLWLVDFHKLRFDGFSTFLNSQIKILSTYSDIASLKCLHVGPAKSRLN